VLGEIVLRRDPDGDYVNLDLPPLLTVASSYLDRFFGDRVTMYDAVAAEGPIELTGSACLPNWRINDLRAPFDVFFDT
jgi:putative sugar O-methyltransferase